MNTKTYSKLLDSNQKQNKKNKKTAIEPNSFESNPFKPKKNRDFELYSDQVINSKHSNNRIYPEDRFTNFLNRDNIQNFKDNIGLFWPDLQKLNNHFFDESDYFLLPQREQERLERIFKLYLDKPFSLENINKIKLRTYGLNKSTPFRVFVILEDDKYLIFLLDPLHLVVPDTITRDNQVYEKNKGNGTCMSGYLK